jgi:hypothetical protein
LFQLAYGELDEYASRVVELLERYGISLSRPAPGESIEVLEADDGSLSLEVRGSLPDGRVAPLSEVVLRERFEPFGPDRLERTGYEYELIDHEREARRAFHLHDAEWFERRFLVVVHEHCEHPIGHRTCAHYQGSPIRDGYAAVETLLDVWTGPLPDCDALSCLED